MKNSINAIVGKIYQFFFILLPARHPFSVKFWLFLRSILNVTCPTNDALLLRSNIKISKGKDVKIQEISSILGDDTLGEWSLDAESICYLWKTLHDTKPKLIIECGAGVSTIVFAKYASMLPAKYESLPIVITIEQNYDVKLSIESRLEKNNLLKYNKIIHAPIDKNDNYHLVDAELIGCLNGRLADLLLIDGPSGSTGCRVSTLPLLRPYCDQGARWMLDDAIRDGELTALQVWSKMRGVKVDGIYPIGKGLATGCFF